MFNVDNEILNSISEALQRFTKPVTEGADIRYACNGCTGHCKNNCVSGCKGSCKNSCTRSCKGNSR